MSQSQSTRTRGQWVFAKMASIYGSRFLDRWRDVNRSEAEAMWTQAMHGMSEETIRRGIAKLFHTPQPPTLPEWLELCRPHPAMHQPALPDESGITPPEEARAQLARIADAVSSAMQYPAGDPLAWARRLIARHERGESVTSRQLEHAQAAVAAWQATHGTAKAQGEGEPPREPGCDDELVA
jgi:hypothetical protein